MNKFQSLENSGRQSSSHWKLCARFAVAVALCLLGAGPALAGNCLVCGASGDYADATNLPTGLSKLTVEAWVYHNQITNRVERYVTLGSKVAVLRMDGASSPGQLHFYIKTSGTLRHLRVNNAMTNGGWHHVAGTWNGTTMRLYEDGVELTNAVPGGTLDALSGSIKVGTRFVGVVERADRRGARLERGADAGPDSARYESRPRRLSSRPRRLLEIG